MNKKDIALIAGVIVLIVVAVFALGNNSSKVELPLALSGEDVGSIQIDYATYKSKVDNGDNFIVVIERTGCSYCEMYLPILDDATAELSIPVYYIDTADLTEEEYTELNDSNSYLRRNNLTDFINIGTFTIPEGASYEEIARILTK